MEADPAAPVTPRGREPILDPDRLGKEVDAPGAPRPKARDSDDGASKDPRDQGNNGNPAQSAGRVTMEEQNRNPEPLEDPNAPSAVQP